MKNLACLFTWTLNIKMSVSPVNNQAKREAMTVIKVNYTGGLYFSI